MILPVLVGIVLFHMVTEPDELPMVIILLTINLWVITENRKKYLPMINN